MAELTYRDAVIRGIAQEMTRDPDVVFLGEDVGKPGGVFKATVGLFEQFGPVRVRDTPISEQAILGAAMGAAMTGLKPIAEIMFSDFFAVCFDYIANEFAKSRYMSNGQLKCPLVVRTGNGGGARFGAQHSQSVENWCMMIPGLKVVAPSNPRDVAGLAEGGGRAGLLQGERAGLPDPVLKQADSAIGHGGSSRGLLASLLVVWPLGGKFRERDRRLVRDRVEEAGQARTSVQAGLVVPLGEGVQEEHPLLVRGGLGKRRVPGTMGPQTPEHGQRQPEPRPG